MKQPNWDTCDSSEEGQQCRQRMQAGRCTRTAALPDRRATCHQEARVSVTLYLRIALTKVRCHVITVLQRTKRSPQKPGNYNEGPGGGGRVSKACRKHWDTFKELAPMRWQITFSCAAALWYEALLPTDLVCHSGRHPEWEQARGITQRRLLLLTRLVFTLSLQLRAVSEQNLPGPKIKDIVPQTYKNQEEKKL